MYVHVVMNIQVYMGSNVVHVYIYTCTLCSTATVIEIMLYLPYELSCLSLMPSTLLQHAISLLATDTRVMM